MRIERISPDGPIAEPTLASPRTSNNYHTLTCRHVGFLGSSVTAFGQTEIITVHDEHFTDWVRKGAVGGGLGLGAQLESVVNAAVGAGQPRRVPPPVR